MLLTRGFRTSRFLPLQSFPLSSLFRPIARSAPALLRPGLVQYAFTHFHTSPWLKQNPHNPSPQHPPPTLGLDPSLTVAEFHLRAAFPSYGDANPAQKIAMIQRLREEFESPNTELRKEMDKRRWDSDSMKRTQAEAIEALNKEEEKVAKKNRWYHQAFRSIAWGPTIMINMVLAMFWF
ncbi:MAG: hypothetical protein HETSPECPRED_006574 [Heterodermia speciosa]|uniref:Uncharacterized protein n=1 Tax=Heterodermia speciosa TaxID=116794 RepID=A0A8H3FML2_9LECA|nr:MAG: hypothetical protein HETSPECPRED_006574 [Heterodermia speciosa]